MKAFALFLCLIATTAAADAEPLHLKCDGKEYRDPSDAKLVTYSIKIDARNVALEGGDPMHIYTDDGDILTFGKKTTTTVLHGAINSITGHVTISFAAIPKNVGQFYDWDFEGVCHKTEKRF
jgi:hypothetical protein